MAFYSALFQFSNLIFTKLKWTAKLIIWIFRNSKNSKNFEYFRKYWKSIMIKNWILLTNFDQKIVFSLSKSPTFDWNRRLLAKKWPFTPKSTILDRNRQLKMKIGRFVKKWAIFHRNRLYQNEMNGKINYFKFPKIQKI